MSRCLFHSLSMSSTYQYRLPHFAERFPVRHFSDKGFSEFIDTAPSHLQNSFVCDMIWWQSKRAPLHHQFLVLTVAHQRVSENDCLVAIYDIRVERVGKGVSFHGTAEHRITIVPAQSATSYRKDSKLFFGLTDALPHLHRDTENDLPDQCISVSAFVDKLDKKWQGPPATLWHIARYVDAIVKLEPRYRLGSTNCYYFARTLFYMTRPSALLVPLPRLGRRENPRRYGAPCMTRLLSACCFGFSMKRRNLTVFFWKDVSWR